MVQMTSKYLGDLRTEGIHLRSGNKIITDAPVDNQGKGEAYSPTDLVCAALSSCMMTIMGQVAVREQIELTGMTSEITKVMVANPRRISEIKIKLEIPYPEKLSDKQKEVLRRAALTCPVAMSLHPDIKQEVEFNF
ncbi:MAG TPA: OsmC family protein [Cytophagaceae bacterium]